MKSLKLIALMATLGAIFSNSAVAGVLCGCEISDPPEMVGNVVVGGELCDLYLVCQTDPECAEFPPGEPALWGLFGTQSLEPDCPSSRFVDGV